MHENMVTERRQGLASSQESGQEMESPYVSERAGGQQRPQDLALLIVEELKRKDAQIARLEALLQQRMAATPMEHELDPESAAPNPHPPQSLADPSNAAPLPQRGAAASFQSGAIVYDMPTAPVAAEAAPSVTPVAQGAPSMVSGDCDVLPVAPQPRRIRLADMKIEPSPVAHTVMQAAMQRQPQHAPAFDPTLRLEAPHRALSRAPLRAARNGHAARNKMAAGLAFLAFAGTLGVLQTRAARREPQSSALPVAPDASRGAGRKYLLNAPAAVNPPSRPLEILPAEPAPRTVKHPAERGAHIAALVPAAHRANPLPHAASAYHAFAYHASTYHASAHPVSGERQYAAVTPAHHSHLAAPTVQTRSIGVHAAPGGRSVRDHQTKSRSPVASPAETMTASAEVLPGSPPDAPDDNSASDLRASPRRRYRRYAAEASERRSGVYRYGEKARKPLDYDADFDRHPAPVYDERADAWMDRPPR